MKRYRRIGLMTFLAVALRAGMAIAQAPPVAHAPSAPLNPLADANANDTREQLIELLNRYPPTLLRVLQTDPSLLQNKDYLTPYPGLNAFVAKHPEILHNASFFLGTPDMFEQSPDRNNAFEITREVSNDAAVAIVLMTIAGAITWIVRSVIEHRRWARILKTQTDIHSRLMDRLTSSEDLLAYIQSPAGKRILEFAPVATGPGAGGPMLSRIFWSVQAGLVLGLAGIGLAYASEHVGHQAAQPFFVLGVLGIAVGAGFIVSALASFLIARNMGLVHGTSETPPT